MSSSVRTTWAPGITAPVGSVATPVRELPYTCAFAAGGESATSPRIRRTDRMPVRAVVVILRLPPWVKLLIEAMPVRGLCQVGRESGVLYVGPFDTKIDSRHW